MGGGGCAGRRGGALRRKRERAEEEAESRDAGVAEGAGCHTLRRGGRQKVEKELKESEGFGRWPASVGDSVMDRVADGAKSSVRSLSISCASGQGLRLQLHVRQMQFAQQLSQQRQQQQEQQQQQQQQHEDKNIAV